MPLLPKHRKCLKRGGPWLMELLGLGIILGTILAWFRCSTAHCFNWSFFRNLDVIWFLCLFLWNQVFLGHSGGLDTDGNELPRLVYVSREKRPGFQHHKKAGAMNALVCFSLHEFTSTPGTLFICSMLIIPLSLVGRFVYLLCWQMVPIFSMWIVTITSIAAKLLEKQCASWWIQL